MTRDRTDFARWVLGAGCLSDVKKTELAEETGSGSGDTSIDSGSGDDKSEGSGDDKTEGSGSGAVVDPTGREPTAALANP